MISIKLCSIFVDDQDKALDFYTNKIGFCKNSDIPVGQFRWLTVSSENSQFEMVLEPNEHNTAKAYQKAIFEDNIPATMLFVDDMEIEFTRLSKLGVEFKSEPSSVDGMKLATFNDTCGNWIMICQLL